MTSPSSDPEAAAGDLFAAALTLSARGLPVFPVKPRSKVPATVDGFKSATIDPDQLRAWWQQWPDANVGVPTGAVSGFVVLDVDARHGGVASFEKLRDRHQLPKTAQVLTGSGGFHYWFRHIDELRNSAGLLGDGLDVRGDGGYVVAPPSVHESGNPYKWLRGLEQAVDWPAALTADADKRRNGASAKVDEVIPEGKRRAAMLTVAGKLKRAGLSGPEILPSLRELNKRCQPPLDKHELESVAHESTIEPEAETAIRTAPVATPQPIDEVLEVFGRWLYLPDPGPVLVTCAAIAANRVATLDPTWLILVGAAGSGKTEALNATSRLDGVHVVATLTEASLLSGTPRKEAAAGATGGLLREIGEAGVIVLKDFGSVLSMHRDARASVLAALRELFDGSWTRLIGSDGGRRLHWEGRVGLLAGATTVLDQHHAVMAQLGERFLIYRVTVDEAPEQGRSSLAHHGRERGMRQELADAVAGLFAGLNLTDPPPLADADVDRLVALAELVAHARSPVIRDSYRREIELVPDSEAPGRIIGALARLLTGLRMIGVGEAEAWRVTVKTGLDSMPAARRQTLEFLIEQDSDPSTTDVATWLGLPNPTTHRVLGDLAAHRVISRVPQGQGKADLWRVKRRTQALYRAATTSSEMSEDMLSNDSDNTFDDFSEEVTP
jgi:hypothetical protein